MLIYQTEWDMASHRDSYPDKSHKSYSYKKSIHISEKWLQNENMT